MKPKGGVIEVGGKTEAALVAEWDAFHAETQGIQTPPPGAMRPSDYAARYDVCEVWAGKLLRRNVKAGKLESGVFRVASGQSARYYWPAKKPAKEAPPCRSNRSRA